MTWTEKEGRHAKVPIMPRINHSLVECLCESLGAPVEVEQSVQGARPDQTALAQRHQNVVVVKVRSAEPINNPRTDH